MVILEVADGYAAALSDDGTISRIPNRNYRVGQTLCCPKRESKNRFTVYVHRIAAVAAVFVFLFLGAGFILNRMPVSYISLDVNPSVQYKLNVFNQVVDIIPLNEDAKALLENTSFVNQPADKAIQQTVELLGESNYLTSAEKNDILISATSSLTEKSKEALTAVVHATEETTQSLGVVADIIVVESSMSDLKQAEKLGTTPGKLVLVNEIAQADVVSIDPVKDADAMEEVQDLLDKPVKELVSALPEDGLTQLCQTNANVTYIPSTVSCENPDGSNDSNAAAASLPGDGEDLESSQEGEAAVSNPSSASSASEQAGTESQANTSDFEGSSSSDPSMDPGTIPPVNPGAGTSSTEDTTSAPDRENSPGTSSETSSSEPNTSEIPVVDPGISTGETEDSGSEIDRENSGDTTTSAPEVPDNSDVTSSGENVSSEEVSASGETSSLIDDTTSKQDDASLFTNE